MLGARRWSALRAAPLLALRARTARPRARVGPAVGGGAAVVEVPIRVVRIRDLRRDPRRAHSEASARASARRGMDGWRTPNPSASSTPPKTAAPADKPASCRTSWSSVISIRPAARAHACAAQRIHRRSDCAMRCAEHCGTTRGCRCTTRCRQCRAGKSRALCCPSHDHPRLSIYTRGARGVRRDHLMEHVVEDVLQHALYPHHLRQRPSSTQLSSAAGPTEPQQQTYRAAWDMPRRQLPKRASAHIRRGEG